jgi:hypothetical protein
MSPGICAHHPTHTHPISTYATRTVLEGEAAAPFEQGLDGEDGADRVTEGDAAAVRVGPVLRQAEFFNYGERQS